MIAPKGTRVKRIRITLEPSIPVGSVGVVDGEYFCTSKKYTIVSWDKGPGVTTQGYQYFVPDEDLVIWTGCEQQQEDSVMNMFRIFFKRTVLKPVDGGNGAIVYQPEVTLEYEKVILAKDQQSAIAAAGSDFGKFDPRTDVVVIQAITV